MSSVSYVLTADVIVPAWVVEQSSEHDASELALAAVEAGCESGIGAGWTLDGEASVDEATGNLVVPMIANAVVSSDAPSDELRVIINPYSDLLEDVDGFDVLSDDAFQDAVNSLKLVNIKVTESRMAA